MPGIFLGEEETPEGGSLQRKGTEEAATLSAGQKRSQACELGSPALLMSGREGRQVSEGGAPVCAAPVGLPQPTTAHTRQYLSKFEVRDGHNLL